MREKVDVDAGDGADPETASSGGHLQIGTTWKFTANAKCHPLN